MASLSPVGIFEEARDRVIGEIDSIVEILNDKRAELLAEIGSLEREFLDRQREKQNDINKLNTLISHTEELGQNTLLEVQQRVTQELNQEINKLNQQTLQPEYTVAVQWGFNRDIIISHVNSSKIGKVLSTVTVKMETEREDLSSSPLPDVLWDQVPQLCPADTDPKLDSVSCEDNPVPSSPEGSPVVDVHLLPEDVSTESNEYYLVEERGGNACEDMCMPLAPSRRESSTHREPSRGQHRRYYDYAPRGTHEHPRGQRREHNEHPRGQRREYSHPRGGSRRDMNRDYNKYREY